MSLKLQVLIPNKDMKYFKKQSKEAGVSLGEWVRRALRQYATRPKRKSVQQKLDAIAALSKMNLPVGTVEEMNREIELGRNLHR